MGVVLLSGWMAARSRKFGAMDGSKSNGSFLIERALIDMEKSRMSDSSETRHTLMCSEVWGGNRKIFRTVQLASVTAWVASVPLNEGAGGGDLHYMSVCDHELISRVALADVSGHGRVVSSMAETLQRLMRENINAWDQSDFMHGLNETFLLTGQHKYATAIVLSFHRITGQLSFSNAGHLPPLWYHARHKIWGWLEEHDDPLAKRSGLPIGLIPGTDYRQTVVTLEPSDLLVLYTDGVTEAENGTGESLDREQLLKWAQEAAVDSPQALGRTLLQRLESFQGRCRNDDETLIVLQREKASDVASLGNVAVNHSVPPLDELEVEAIQTDSRGE
jgi:sigma-B regulation protein RsbU (phosphoserine phosphatase)